MPSGAPKHSLGVIAGKYIGKPFSEFSCAQLVWRIYADMGITIPDRVGELTLENYMETYQKRPRWVMGQLTKIVKTIGKQIYVSEAFVFDLLLCWQPKPRILFPGVCAGAGVLASTVDDGVSVIPFSRACYPVLARRVI